MEKMVTLLPKRVADKIIRTDNEKKHIGLENNGNNIVFYTTAEDIERIRTLGKISSVN